MKENLKYPMLIQWSEEDQCFLVGFPDFPGQKWRYSSGVAPRSPPVVRSDRMATPTKKGEFTRHR